MSTTLLRPAQPPLRTAPHRRLISVLVAALFGLLLALNPISTQTAGAVVPASVGVRALHVAAAQLGVPYRWGGTSRATGFDCSGLTQYAYGRVGRRIPRTAQQQFQAAIRVNKNRIRPGDLVFFYTGNVVWHEAIYAGGGYIIHAPHTGARVKRVRLWTGHVLYGRVR